MACTICDLIKSKQNILFEDEDIFAYLDPDKSAQGMVILTTKSHFPIFELVSDDLIEHLFVVANKISILIFEKLKAKGTNILINNGISAGQMHPHFTINIIPRFENDNMNFSWEPRKFTEEELYAVELKYKEINEQRPKTHEPKKPPKRQAQEDYLIKHLERLA